jgi:uncharacterized membrane protein
VTETPTQQRSTPPRQAYLRTIARLALITAMPAALYIARFIYTDKIAYRFLPWNLFLAWLPLIFAYLALRAGRRRPALAVPLIAAWLAFLPNAPYLITDLVWLDGRASTLKIYDAAMFFAFATCGLAAGFVSLRWMQAFAARGAGLWGSRAFVLAALGLTGFGVYLGRFRRWNSWDVVTDPLALLRDIAARLADPVRHWQTWALTALFAGLLLFLYWLFGVLTEAPAGEGRAVDRMG